MCATILCLACSGPPAGPAPPAQVLPEITGTTAVDGLAAPVRIVRDRWGVPHIKAENQHDLFFAQGFVQAQDRLFQMDLWRRSVQGRLSEVLGPNFIERDAMTRRIQFRGDVEAEWASYGADTKAIATAFTQGINAWVSRARGQRPEDFALAGWAPEFWRPEDLLNRTDAFVASANAQDEVLRMRLVAASGVDSADLLLPTGAAGPTVIPPGLDIAAINYVVADVLRQVGTAPFFMSLAAPVGSNAWAVARGHNGRPLLATDPHRPLENPSPRYLVHLEAPGWNVAGATSPWMPGVAIGHNDRIAWSMTAANIDTQDVYVEKVNPANPGQVQYRGRWGDVVTVKDAIGIRGRSKPLEYDAHYTPHGVTIAGDPERHLSFVVRWSGTEPGAAAELAALAIDRARSPVDFRAALARWKMPPAEFVYADVDGNIGRQVAALTPVRDSWKGVVPVPGDAGRYEWRGWSTIDDLPRATNPASGYVASANDNRARLNRISEVLTGSSSHGPDGFKRFQHDALAWNAERLVPLVAGIRSDRADVEASRQQLLRWDRRMTTDSAEATLYATWEAALLRRLAALRVPQALLDDYMRRAAPVLVAALVHPSRFWFDAPVDQSRDRLLADALAAATDELHQRRDAGDLRWGRFHTVTFAHPFGISERARQRFNIGPFAMAGYADTVLSLSTGPDRAIGASFRAIFDLGGWDRSIVMNAPGQSALPGSPHFGDLAAPWAAGEYFPLAFSDEAIQANAGSTLTLVPR